MRQQGPRLIDCRQRIISIEDFRAKIGGFRRFHHGDWDVRKRVRRFAVQRPRDT